VATRTWDGYTSDKWSEDNWGGDPSPVNGDSVIFAGSSELTPDNDISSLSLVDITFASGASEFTLDGNSITLTGGVTNNSSNDQNINMAISLPSGVHVFDSANGRIDIESVVSGVGSITKNGNNQLRFENNNSSWSGGMQWNAGDVRGHNSNSFGSGKITMDSTGLLRLQGNMTVPNNFDIDSIGGMQSLGGSGNTLAGDILLNTDWEFRNKLGSTPLTLSGVISGSGGIIQDNSYTDITLSGDNTFTGDTEINASKVIAGHLSALRYSTVVVGASGTLDISGQNTNISGLEGAGNVTLGVYKLTFMGAETYAAHTGVISGTGEVQKNATGTIVLNGLNTYTGQTTVVQGTLEYNSIGDVGGGASALGNPSSVANGTIELGRFDPVLKYTGSGDTTDRVLHFTGTPGAHYIEMAGTGTLTFQTNWTVDDSDRTIYFTGSTAGEGYLNTAAIPDGATTGVTTVIKQGSGVWTFNGNDSYTGVTDVTAGKLAINGDPIGTTGLLTVSSGAVLGGSGNIYSPVTISNGGILSPSLQAAGPGEILQTANPTILNSTSILDFLLGTVSDRVDASGALTLDGVINVIEAAGFVAGTYTILNYAGALTNNGLTVGIIPDGYTAVVDTLTPNVVKLIVSEVSDRLNLVGNLDGGLKGGFQ